MPKIGRYEIESVLGEGGMGVVYAAFDPQLDRKIAIKVVRSARAGGREARERAVREAQAMARLSHQNVVLVHDAGEADDGVFIAMELVDGVTLDTWLTTSRPWRARLATMKAAGRGLAAAHAAGIVHRDFKPSNVLVGPAGRVRVTDFGIARSIGEMEPERAARADAPRLDEPLTETGSILGTVGFMAPEQAFGEDADTRSDQFSFCVTLYFALYGRRPFAGKTAAEYTDSVTAGLRALPADSEVPAWLGRIVRRGLSTNPEDRYPSMTALLDALDRDPRRRWLVAGAATAVVLGAFGFARLLGREKEHACDAAAPSLAGIWDENVKRDMRTAFSGAPDTYERAAAVLDTYAHGMSSMQVDACRATRVQGVQSEADYRRRSDCLDRRMIELGALTSLFRRADPEVVDSAVKAAYELASLSWCADLRALRANEGLPDDPQRRAGAIEARRRLAEANALLFGDKNAAALALTDAILVNARAALDERTEAEALLLAGRAQHRLGDDAMAQRSLTGAALLGSASGQGELMVRASAILAYVIGVDLQRGDEARDWIARANATVRKMGGNEELETFIASREGSILHGYDHRPELAAPIFERTASAYRRLLGVHPNTQRELKNLGDVYIALGRRDLALGSYREASTMAETLFGPDSMQSTIALAAVGDAQLKLGEWAAGITALERALVNAERKQNAFWIVAILQELARAFTRSGDPAKALPLGERAALLVKNPVLVPASYVTEAEALLALGRAAEALPLCERALAAQTILPDGVYEWDALRCVGEARLATGQPAAALAPLERSVSLTRREWPGDLGLARFALARALVATKGDAGRARALALAARTELAALPDQKAAVVAIDAWLGKQL